jgi:uncharacterized protein (DUF58 family)
MRIQKPFWILIVIMIVAITGALVTRADLFYRMFYVVVLLVVVCFLWAFFSNQGYRFKRMARGYYCQQGDYFEENYEVSNRLHIIPPWIAIEDLSDLPQSGGNRIITWKRGERNRRFQASTYLIYRGTYNLGPTLITSGDPLGLFTFAKRFDYQNSLLVLPYTIKLKRFFGSTGMGSGGLISRKKGSDNFPPQVSGIREYVPGDPLSHIHWASTAKKDRWMVREFELDPKPQVWILLDSCSQCYVRSIYTPGQHNYEKQIDVIEEREFVFPKDTFEYATSIAASISDYYIKSKIAVGFISVGQRKFFLPAEYGEKQLEKILGNLALIQADGNLNISGLVEGYALSIPRNSTILLITSCCGEETSRGVESLIRKGLHPIVILLDQLSFGGEVDSGAINLKIQGMGIPIRRIFYEDNLKSVLEG